MIVFWVAALGLITLLYVLLDGFDLGVGILFGFTRSEEIRGRMLAAISPVWDGNETWLVLAGTVLFGAFPKVYATLLSAFYLPIILMLDLARHRFRVPLQGAADALALGSRFFRRLASCELCARNCHWCPGEGAAFEGWALCRWQFRLA
jgi:hypothetical protein